MMKHWNEWVLHKWTCSKRTSNRSIKCNKDRSMGQCSRIRRSIRNYETIQLTVIWHCPHGNCPYSWENESLILFADLESKENTLVQLFSSFVIFRHICELKCIMNKDWIIRMFNQTIIGPLCWLEKDTLPRLLMSSILFVDEDLPYGKSPPFKKKKNYSSS